MDKISWWCQVGVWDCVLICVRTKFLWDESCPSRLCSFSSLSCACKSINKSLQGFCFKLPSYTAHFVLRLKGQLLLSSCNSLLWSFMIHYPCSNFTNVTSSNILDIWVFISPPFQPPEKKKGGPFKVELTVIWDHCSSHGLCLFSLITNLHSSISSTA